MVWLCGALVFSFCAPAHVAAQIKKVDGYEGYKFGMTLDQAKKVNPSAQQTRCTYVSVTACLEYPTTVSIFPAMVVVQFEGAPPLLRQVLLTIKSSAETLIRSCTEVTTEVVKLLIAKYGNRPLVRGFEAVWASPDGGSVILSAFCTNKDEGLNIIAYTSSSPL